MEPFNYIVTLFFSEEIFSNSCPIKFTCFGGQVYYVKIAQSKTDYDDLIYEGIAVHLANLFKIPIPPYAIVNVIQSSYNLSDINSQLNKTFIQLNPIAFGSLDVKNHEILGPQNDTIFNKHDFNRFLNPIDYLKIGIFDFHITNTDRSYLNYNIIFDVNFPKGKRKFLAIDHVAIFGGTILKNRFTPQCNNNLAGNILNCPFGETIIDYLKKDYGPNILSEVIESYFAKIKYIPDIINAYFETIPEEWRYNEDLPNRMIAYLINEERNVYLQSELRKLLKISG